MFVFAIVSFLFFSEYQFAVDITRLEFTHRRIVVFSLTSIGETHPPQNISTMHIFFLVFPFWSKYSNPMDCETIDLGVVHACLKMGLFLPDHIVQ
jgi:hypothetical protein